MEEGFTLQVAAQVHDEERSRAVEVVGMEAADVGRQDDVGEAVERGGVRERLRLENVEGRSREMPRRQDPEKRLFQDKRPARDVDEK